MPLIPENPTSTPNSTSILTIANFNLIQQFIIAQGKRQTYCAMYNNNPYWPFPGFNAYLNPPDQRNINCEIGRSDFNVLVIQVVGPGKSRYLDVSLDKEKKELRVTSPDLKTDQKDLINEAAGFFKRALAEIS